MKPVDRPLHHDLYIVVQQSSTGSFMLCGVGGTINGMTLGSGFYHTLELAQQEQTVQALKGIRTEVFHLEYPIKTAN